MGKKVQSENYRQLKYYAECKEPGCDFSLDWREDIKLIPAKLRYHSKKHTLKTGHRVTIFYGGEIDYSLSSLKEREK